MDKIHIEPLTAARCAQWEQFVCNSNNGTLFHLRQFLNYHPPHRFEDRSLLFFKKNQLLAVLPAALRHGDPEKLLVSHPGASFGGFVVNRDLSLRDATRLVAALMEFAAEAHFGGILLTLPPIIYLQQPSQYLDFALFRAGFSYKKREVSSVIPLPEKEEALLSLFSAESRRAVRRAQKLGVRIELSTDIAAFYAILKENLHLRHNVIPTHSLDELQLLAGTFPDRIRLFAAFVEARMVAGIVLFDANERATLAFYISHDEAYQRMRSVNLLFYEVFRWCVQNRFRYLDFGIFTVNMEPNWGLARFKEGFGARGVFRDSMQLKF